MRQKPHGFGPPTARLKPKSPDHGRHIYAYRHVQTNQVLYSLTRTLDGIRSLRQLPDVGANTPQATGRIRRDLWRPLWSVTFPHAEHGPEQGQHAFRHLREWRRLHELYWKQPASLSQPMSKEKKEELQKLLDERRVEKKETVFDLIKKEKRKHKREIIMDQKANSIADLAAVLDAQEWLGVAMEQRHDRVRTQERVREVREMLRLGLDARDGGIVRLEQEIADLQPFLERKEGFRLEDGAMSQREAQRKLFELQWKLEKMRIAESALANLPRRGEQMRRLDELETRLRDDLAGTSGGGDSIRLEGELDGILQAKDLIRHGRSLQQLSEAMKEERLIRDSRPNAAPDTGLSKAEAEALQLKVDGSEAALNPAAVFAKLQSTSSDSSVDLGASDLPAILKDINQQLSALRLDKFRSWATGKDDRVNAKAQRLKHDKALCELLMPSYTRAKSELEYDGGEAKLKRWIEDARTQLAAAPVQEASQQRKERAAGLVHGYEQAMEALREIESATPKDSPPESSVASAQAWLESLHGREAALTKWYKSAPGRAIKDAEREVPDELDVGSAEPATPGLEAKFLRTWIAMQKWAIDRNRKRVKTIASDKLTPEQQNRMETFDRELKELERQTALIRSNKLSEVIEGVENPNAADAIAKAWNEIESELSQIGPGSVEPIQVLAAKLEVYREALARAERSSDSVFPEIKLPGSLQQTVNDWTDLRKIDYESLSQVNFLNILPSFPPPPTPDPVLFRNKHHPVTAMFKGQGKLFSHPVFTLQGVRVKWHNILDAEYAASWPEDVVHEPMGLVTYVAPEADATEEPVLDVAEWRRRRNEKRLAKRREREVVVDGLADAVVRAVKKGRGNDQSGRLYFETEVMKSEEAKPER